MPATAIKPAASSLRPPLLSSAANSPGRHQLEPYISHTDPQSRPRQRRTKPGSDFVTGFNPTKFTVLTVSCGQGSAARKPNPVGWSIRANTLPEKRPRLVPTEISARCRASKKTTPAGSAGDGGRLHARGEERAATEPGLRQKQDQKARSERGRGSSRDYYYDYYFKEKSALALKIPNPLCW